MRLNTVKLLGISITTDRQETILEEIKKCLSHAKKPFVIVTPNPEQLVLAQRDGHFAQILNGADVAVPDGVGLVWASRFLAGRTVQKIAGVELMENLVALAAREGVPVGLIGGRAGLAVRALECLRAQYPKLEGWAEDGPEIPIHNEGEYFRRLAQKIQQTKTRIVFVGLGAPKQEYFIERLSRETQIVLMSVGGSFDEISGRLPRAPRWLDSLGLKWLWRLALEPWRWKRQLALVEFLWLVFRARFFR